MFNKILKTLLFFCLFAIFIAVFLSKSENTTYANEITNTIADTPEGIQNQVSIETNNSRYGGSINTTTTIGNDNNTEKQLNSIEEIKTENINTDESLVIINDIIDYYDKGELFSGNNENEIIISSGSEIEQDNDNVIINNTGELFSGNNENEIIISSGSEIEQDNDNVIINNTGELFSGNNENKDIEIIKPYNKITYSGNLINIDSIKSYNISGGIMTYCSMISKLNLQDILSYLPTVKGIGSGLEISEGNAIDLIGEGLAKEKIIYVSGNYDSLSGKLFDKYNLFGSSIFDFYIYNKNLIGEYRGHRFVAIIASDKNIYVLDPIRSNNNIQPILMSEYFTNINQSESDIYMYNYSFVAKYNTKEKIESLNGIKLNLSNLIGLFQSGSIIPKYTEVGGISEISFSKDIIFINNQSGRVTVYSGTIIKEINGKNLNIYTLGFEQNETGFVLSTGVDKEKIINFGISGQHLIFSKPIKISINNNLPDGEKIIIQVKHAGDEEFGKSGITMDETATCDNSGHSSNEDNVGITNGGALEFYTCGASIFSVSYVGGATAANYTDANFKEFTVNFITGTSFATGTKINDVNISISWRPIDNESPTGPRGTTNCYPGEKSFQLYHPDGTVINLINAGQLSSPNLNCPQVTTIFDDQTTNPAITNSYASNTYKPTAGNLLSVFNNKSPFGGWRVRMRDSAGADGVIMFGFTITINGVDLTPYVNNDIGTISEDGSGTISVLNNDIFAIGVLITGLTNPANGVVIIIGTGIKYTPNANFCGNDSFTYKAFNGSNTSTGTATVNITVTCINDNPIAAGYTMTINEDNSGIYNFLSGASDVDIGDILSLSGIVSAPTKGSISITGLYIPNANYCGSDTFTYRIKDQTGGVSNIATGTIIINCVNDVPVAVNDIYTGYINTGLNISIGGGVLANDSDVDNSGSQLQAILISGTSNGTLSLGISGGFVYTPNPYFIGTDTFSYYTKDPSGSGSTGATVTINVIGNGVLCIYSPSGYITGKVTSASISQALEHQFDYFRIEDAKSKNSGYYTTISVSNLSGANGSISNNNISIKADPKVTLAGSNNANVLLNSTLSTYQTANITYNFLYRNAGINNIAGVYGSKLWIKVNIPAYQAVGTYNGTITYTLYEN